LSIGIDGSYGSRGQIRSTLLASNWLNDLDEKRNPAITGLLLDEMMAEMVFTAAGLYEILVEANGSIDCHRSGHVCGRLSAIGNCLAG
jgi:hypothetical protein